MSCRVAVGDADPAGRAEAAARLVGTNPPQAQAVAQEAVALARAAGDAAAAARAHRAHGRAALELGRLDEATRSFRTAVRAAERGGEPTTAAECRVSLAYALSERGRTADALLQLDRAAAVLRGQQAAGVLMQRGVVLWRGGRTDEALASWRRPRRTSCGSRSSAARRARTCSRRTPRPISASSPSGAATCRPRSPS